MSVSSAIYSIYRRVPTCYCSDYIRRDQLKTQIFSAAYNLVFYQKEGANLILLQMFRPKQAENWYFPLRAT